MYSPAYSPYAGTGQRAVASRVRAQAGPVAVIVLAHLAFFYMIYSGLLGRIVHATLPPAVLVTFVPSPSAPATQRAPKLAQIVPQTPPAVPVVTPLPVVMPDAVSVSSAPVAEKAAPGAPAAVVAAAAPPAPPASSPSGPRTIVSGVEYLQAPQPVYPQAARRMGEQGRVMLRILINEQGLPEQITVQTSSGSARLDDAARQAAQRALFKPHLEDGRPVAVYVLVPLNFSLAG